jgi:hypothetical protein
MTTPNKSEIIAKAQELYAQDCYRSGTPQLADLNPEISELREGGYLSAAQSDLMRNLETKNAEWENYDPTEILEFEVNVDQALKNGTYTCGTRGCGKSDLNMMLADALMKRNVIVCAFDPSRDWLKRSSIQKYVTVRPYTNIEIPLESQIYDLSILTLKQQKESVERFNRAIFNYQIVNASRWYFCIYEEAHQYFPQGVLRSSEMQYTVRLLTQGRNFKISMGLVTQFSAMLDKDAMKFMEQRFFGASNEPNDAEYVSKFFPKKDRDAITETLRDLKAGQFLNMEQQIFEIQSYEGSTDKTEITAPTAQPLPKIAEPQPQADYGALIKPVVICFLGLLILLIGGR